MLSFNDKRFLLAYIDNVKPFPYEHAYVHYEIEYEVTHDK